MEKLFGLRWNRIRESIIWGTLQAFTWILTGILIWSLTLVVFNGLGIPVPQWIAPPNF